MQSRESWLADLITRWRIRRYESKRRKNEVADRNSGERVDRLAEGIKNAPGPGL